MSEALKGKSVEAATKLVDAFKNMMLSKSEQEFLPDELEDLEALQGVKKYPVRIKCALLPWNTMLEGLGNIQQTNGNDKS